MNKISYVDKENRLAVNCCTQVMATVDGVEQSDGWLGGQEGLCKEKFRPGSDSI